LLASSVNPESTRLEKHEEEFRIHQEKKKNQEVFEMRLLCLDVGGDKVRCGSVENGKIQGKPKEFPCPASLSGLEKEIGKELEAESYNGVTFATAGVIKEHAIVEISPNIQWLTALNVKQWVLDNLGLPCCRRSY